MGSTSRDISIHLTMLVSENGSEWCSLTLHYKLYICDTTKNAHSSLAHLELSMPI